MHKPQVRVITMGCSKNLVDSEVLMRRLSDVGYELIAENSPKYSANQIVIVNTCGFIGDAKEESIDEILMWAQQKEQGQIGRLIVMGCLSQRYLETLKGEIPEVDSWYGKTDWNGIIAELSKLLPHCAPYDRCVTTGPHTAYVKISEGCNRFCAFCAIPLITGHHRSRPEEEILSEVKMLASRGITEFNVIAQDLSAYGTDLKTDGDTAQSPLARLIDRMADIEGVRRIRLHYAYPKDFPMDVLDVMARRDNVCRYLDIALQHISDKVLTNMRRHITAAQTRELLAEIRRRVPGIHIRTTLMVGFPGEDEDAFDELLDFVSEQRFERMGAFSYCEEDGTYAAKNFRDEVPEDFKIARLTELMMVQQVISEEIQRDKVGKTLTVLIDGEGDDFYVGRTEFDSPEVDPEVLVEKTRLMKVGEYVDVEITDSTAFELYGKEKNRS